MKYLLLAVLLVSSPSKADKIPEATLGMWLLVTYAGDNVSKSQVLTLNIQNNGISGSDGCNKLVLGGRAITELWCNHLKFQLHMIVGDLYQQLRDAEISDDYLTLPLPRAIGNAVFKRTDDAEQQALFIDIRERRRKAYESSKKYSQYQQRFRNLWSENSRITESCINGDTAECLKLKASREQLERHTKEMKSLSIKLPNLNIK